MALGSLGFLFIFAWVLVMVFGEEIISFVERVWWFLRGWRACVKFQNTAWEMIQLEVGAPLAYVFEDIANQAFAVIKKRLRKDWTQEQDNHALWQVNAQLVYLAERWKGTLEKDAVEKALAEYK